MGFYSFLKVLSWDTDTDPWLMVDDLTVKHAKFGRENPYVIENGFSRITILCVTYVQTDI